MSVRNVAIVFGLLLLQAAFIKDTYGQTGIVSACQNLDLAFLIDGSGSICDGTKDYNSTKNTCGNWEFIRQFVYDFVSSLTISTDTTRVAVATFASDAKVLWNLTTYPDKTSLLNAINTTLNYSSSGETHTTEGLNLLTTQIFVPAFDRPNVKNTAIIITDGYPTNNATVPAAIDAVHDAGIRTLVVGVTEKMDQAELKLLSSVPQLENVTYFIANNFSTINQVKAQLYSQTCQNASGTVQPVTPMALTPSSPLGDISLTDCDLIDLCFIVDRSGSICDSDEKFFYTSNDTCDNWRTIVKFIHDLVSRFIIGLSNVRVAMVIFDNSAQLAWGLAKYTTRDSLLTAIDGLTYIKGGTTDTTGGLDMARTQVFNTADDRSDARNVAIIITDGKPTVPSTVEDAVKALQGLQGGGCRTFVVGVTNSIDEKTLKLLSSDPKQDGITYFMAANFSVVNMLTTSLHALLCPQTATPPALLSCTDVQDLVIVLDGSGSICDSDPRFSFTRDKTCDNWASIVQFLHNLVNHFVISPAATRVALILFSDDARLVWGLDVHKDKDTLLYAIDSLQYIKGGTTDTTGALNVLNTQVFTPQLIRPNAAKTAIIVTDGKPTVPSTVEAAVRAVNDSGIRRLVVGVTNQIDNQTLKQISSPPKTLGETYFIATDYQTIDAQVTAQLIAQACPGTPTTPGPTSPRTSGPAITICTKKLDLAFVVDRSGSICGNEPVPTCGNWTDTLKFVGEIVKSLSIGLNETRVGMIIFSSSASVLWNLTTYTDSTSLLSAINNMQYVMYGNTDTTGGLNLLRTSMFVGLDDRPDVNNTAIIVTDGKPSDITTVQPAIAAVHNAGIKTIVVGITNSVDADTLKKLSSPPQEENRNYFKAADFKSLVTLESDLQKQACGA